MVIVALLIGLVAGAAGVYAVGLRRALADRDRANLEAREAERRARRDRGCARGRTRRLRRSRGERDQGALDRGAPRERERLHRAGDGTARGVRRAVAEVARKVEINVNLLEQQRQRAYGEIHKELEIVRQNNEGLRTQTGNLVSALRGESQVRGRWGEIQLRRVIEMAGMLSYCDFDEQQSLRATTDACCGPT